MNTDDLTIRRLTPDEPLRPSEVEVRATEEQIKRLDDRLRELSNRPGCSKSAKRRKR